MTGVLIALLIIFVIIVLEIYLVGAASTPSRGKIIIRIIIYAGLLALMYILLTLLPGFKVTL